MGALLRRPLHVREFCGCFKTATLRRCETSNVGVRGGVLHSVEQSLLTSVVESTSSAAAFA